MHSCNHSLLYIPCISRTEVMHSGSSTHVVPSASPAQLGLFDRVGIPDDVPLTFALPFGSLARLANSQSGR